MSTLSANYCAPLTEGRTDRTLKDLILFAKETPDCDSFVTAATLSQALVFWQLLLIQVSLGDNKKEKNTCFMIIDKKKRCTEHNKK